MDHVCFSYGRGNDPVCQDVSVTLHQGERVALLGANGSGKSTLLALLAGLIHPEGGHIHHHDSAPNSKPARLASSLVLQDPDLSLFCATVREELQFGLANLDVDDGQAEELVGEIAHEFALSELLASPPLALSKGQRLRTAVAAVASLRPRLLLLDEPTTGQDPQQVQRVMAAVSRRAAEHGVAVVFATHDLRTVARYADRVLVLAGGRVVFDGRPTALFADDDRLAAARLHLPPLLALRRRLGLAGMTLDQIVAEVRG